MRVAASSVGPVRSTRASVSSTLLLLCGLLSGAGATVPAQAADRPGPAGSAASPALAASSGAASSGGGVVGEGVVAAADPVIAAVGDMVCDPTRTSPPPDGRDPAQCQDRAVERLAAAQPLAAFLPLGGLQYELGELANFRAGYDPTWGRYAPIVRPVPGNHEYGTPDASGYFDYFGAAAGPRGKGWYSYDVGAWHVVALNTNCHAVSCTAGSEQERWLRADLAAHPRTCTMAVFHQPRFTSSPRGSDPGLTPLWQALHDAHVDVVLNGHEHNYERFAPQDPHGAADPRGPRQFIVGTGGRGLSPFGPPIANSELRTRDHFGLLTMTLRPTGYDWAFRSTNGTTPDSGSSNCTAGPTSTAHGATLRPLDPRRILDTRTGTGAAPLRVEPFGSLRLQVTGPGLAPVGSTAVALNLTAVTPTAPGHLSVHPTGDDTGRQTSSLNFTPGAILANHVLTKVAPDGSITLHNASAGTVDLLVDLTGSYTRPAPGADRRT